MSWQWGSIGTSSMRRPRSAIWLIARFSSAAPPVRGWPAGIAECRGGAVNCRRRARDPPAAPRVGLMTRAETAMHPRDEPPTLDALNRLITASPPLVEGSTQAVLGEGPVGAAL